MDLERKLGFRSSFNFIPEGPYEVPAEVRFELEGSGFEVGVHDLHHDGKLFRSSTGFSKRAERINHYLTRWGAVGFRAGFMLHNLDWTQQLNILYEASTFDTDPFEPQPEGVGTIFPFWVPASAQVAHSRRQKAQTCGFVELPYTLVQDSTLYLLLEETSPDIWFKKLDWIAQHGGMALLNVHPDYVRFNGDSPSALTYPARFYEQFLEYALNKYKGCFWQPLPREVAAFVAVHRVALPSKSRRICMVSYSPFLSDARVSRYAEALAQRGDRVDVLALRASPQQPVEDKIGNITVFYLQSRYRKTERTGLSHLFPILRFFLKSSFWLLAQHRRQPYDLLHIHNIPDFLVFAAWYPKLMGAKVILDLHDIVPEFYASKFGIKKKSFTIRVLLLLERFSAAFAHHVIISNHLWRDKVCSRSRLDGKCSVFINNVDSGVFHPRPRTRRDNKFIMIFPGGLQWHQGLDIAIHAFREVRAQSPNAEFHIYGDGNMKGELLELTKSLELSQAVRFFSLLPVTQVAEIMANADLGVVPKRADSFGNEAYSTKIMEFMSLGVPVIVSRTKIDRFYFDDSVVRFFESGNVDDLRSAILELIHDLELRARLAGNGLEYVALNNWDSRRPAYLALVDSLISGTQPSAAIPPDPFDRPLLKDSGTRKVVTSQLATK
jgi:glycosyltransferase involved in cell wall biosynthesis